MVVWLLSISAPYNLLQLRRLNGSESKVSLYQSDVCFSLLSAANKKHLRQLHQPRHVKKQRLWHEDVLEHLTRWFLSDSEETSPEPKKEMRWSEQSQGSEKLTNWTNTSVVFLCLQTAGNGPERHQKSVRIPTENHPRDGEEAGGW